MTTKQPKLDAEMQKDLLGRPLKCLEGASLEGLTMNDGIALMQKIHDEINGYLSSSPIAKNLARQIATRQKKSANLSIFIDLEIGVTSDLLERQPKTKPNRTPKKMKPQPKPQIEELDTFVLETDDSELDALIAKAQKKGISLRGVPKNIEAIRNHLQSSDEEPLFVLDVEDPLDDLPIIEPAKPSPPRVLGIQRRGNTNPSRLEKLAALAQTRGLEELEQFASKKLGVEETDESQK